MAGQPRENHFPGLEFISQEAAEQLSDPIGNKTSGHRQSGKAFADSKRTLYFSQTGRII